MNHKVDVRLEIRNITTYEPGKPEINPVFLKSAFTGGLQAKPIRYHLSIGFTITKPTKFMMPPPSAETSVLLTGTNEPTDF
jgi:hypothetical protein